jgi:hypothetical protein
MLTRQRRDGKGYDYPSGDEEWDQGGGYDLDDLDAIPDGPRPGQSRKSTVVKPYLRWSLVSLLRQLELGE